MKANRADLLSSYQQVLRETLFNRRTAIRPNMLKGIASNEIDALEAFFSQAATCSVTDRGEKLQQMGLSELAILRMGQVTRQFCVAHLETQHIASALKVIDAYQEAVVQGYMQAQEQTVVKEQELIRSALKKAIGRYMVEIEEIEAIARQATEASEFKTRFIARIGHELRTPLGAMMGMTEMLQEGVYGTLTPEQREITQRIIHKAVVLKEIFTELLDQSQIESGKLRLKAEEFSPKTLIETVHANYLPMALQKGLSVYVKIGSDLPPVLIGDRSRIEQIVTNLAVNAIKFTETGSITLHASLADAAYWEIVVKDTGIGIDAEQLAYVFEPFRQIDETSSRKYGGVGLGLAIVQQLVEAMNGTVAVKSKLGQGTVFTVRLPLQLPD
ncbi:MAG: hypothetical protein KC443_22850 [Anaerolineales bacterium]|nr:hypothetical protein [Anaerolineales bacterium]